MLDILWVLCSDREIWVSPQSPALRWSLQINLHWWVWYCFANCNSESDANCTALAFGTIEFACPLHTQQNSIAMNIWTEGLGALACFPCLSFATVVHCARDDHEEVEGKLSLSAANAVCVDWICCTSFNSPSMVLLSPPASASPHVITFPSVRIAANALWVAWICCTFSSWSCTMLLSPPEFGSPHVTTEPFCKIAANAPFWERPFVAWICQTSLSWSFTKVLSPPCIGLPQETTDPSAKMAAKAEDVAWIALTFLNWPWTSVLSPPWPGSPQVTTDPSCKIAAKASNVDWISLTPISCSWTSLLSLEYASSHPQVTTSFQLSRNSATKAGNETYETKLRGWITEVYIYAVDIYL